MDQNKIVRRTNYLNYMVEPFYGSKKKKDCVHVYNLKRFIEKSTMLGGAKRSVLSTCEEPAPKGVMAWWVPLLAQGLLDRRDYWNRVEWLRVLGLSFWLALVYGLRKFKNQYPKTWVAKRWLPPKNRLPLWLEVTDFDREVFFGLLWNSACIVFSDAVFSWLGFFECLLIFLLLVMDSSCLFFLICLMLMYFWFLMISCLVLLLSGRSFLEERVNVMAVLSWWPAL